MRAVRLAARAELVDLETIGIVATVLLGDVVALFALSAGQGDLGPNVGTLAGHGVPLSLVPILMGVSVLPSW